MGHAGPIRFFALPPTPVRVLSGQQPLGGAADFRRRRIDAGSVEGGQYRPGTVDVVGAPAPEPAAVGFLIAPQKGDRSGDGGMVRVIAELAKQPEAAGADIR